MRFALAFLVVALTIVLPPKKARAEMSLIDLDIRIQQAERDLKRYCEKADAIEPRMALVEQERAKFFEVFEALKSRTADNIEALGNHWNVPEDLLEPIVFGATIETNNPDAERLIQFRDRLDGIVHAFLDREIAVINAKSKQILQDYSAYVFDKTEAAEKLEELKKKRPDQGEIAEGDPVNRALAELDALLAKLDSIPSEWSPETVGTYVDPRVREKLVELANDLDTEFRKVDGGDFELLHLELLVQHNQQNEKKLNDTSNLGPYDPNNPSEAQPPNFYETITTPGYLGRALEDHARAEGLITDETEAESRRLRLHLQGGLTSSDDPRYNNFGTFPLLENGGTWGVGGGIEFTTEVLPGWTSFINGELSTGKQSYRAFGNTMGGIGLGAGSQRHIYLGGNVSFERALTKDVQFGFAPGIGALHYDISGTFTASDTVPALSLETFLTIPINDSILVSPVIQVIAPLNDISGAALGTPSSVSTEPIVTGLLRVIFEF